MDYSYQLRVKIAQLESYTTSVVFEYVRRGLMEVDRLVVASLMALVVVESCKSRGGPSTLEMLLALRPAQDPVFPEEARRCSMCRLQRMAFHVFRSCLDGS